MTGQQPRIFLQHATGNVGIGTATPGAKLDVAGLTNASITSLTQSISNSGILITSDITNTFHNSGLFWRSANNNPTKPKAGIWMYNENGPGSWLLFGTSNSYATGITNTALAIDPSGNVGIGTTNPQAKLHTFGNSGSGTHYWRMEGNTNATLAIEFRSPGTTATINTFNNVMSFHTAALERATITASGNVGIGTTTPNGQVKRDFVTYNTSASNANPIHIKTNIPIQTNIMYRILVEGYNYGQSAIINSDACGYTYVGYACIGSNSVNNYASGVSISQYCSSDGYVVIKLNISSSYYIGFSASAWLTNPTGNSFNIAGTVYHQASDL